MPLVAEAAPAILRPALLEPAESVRSAIPFCDGTRLPRIPRLSPPAPRCLSDNKASRAACAAEFSRIDGAGDPGRWSDARRQWERCSNVHATAYAAWREAEALLAAGGDRDTAEALVREAHGIGAAAGSRLAELELSPGEIEVLALLADGMTNREIAAELFISAKTASVHVSRILSKLSVPTRAAGECLGVPRATGRR